MEGPHSSYSCLEIHICWKVSKVLEDPWHQNATCLGCPRPPRQQRQCCSPALWTLPLNILFHHLCSLSTKETKRGCHCRLSDLCPPADNCRGSSSSTCCHLLHLLRLQLFKLWCLRWVCPCQGQRCHPGQVQLHLQGGRRWHPNLHLTGGAARWP